MIVHEEVVAACGQLTQFRIYKSLNGRVLCRKRKSLIDLDGSFTETMWADIVPVNLCEGSNCLLESQFNQTDLGSLLGYDKVSFQLADNHLHNIEGIIHIGLAHEASDVFVRLCL